MNGTEQVATAGHDRVVALLADRLCGEGVLRWPGTDGMTLEEVVLAAYRGGATAGPLPSPVELAELYPDLAEHIRRYFADVPGATV